MLLHISVLHTALSLFFDLEMLDLGQSTRFKRQETPYLKRALAVIEPRPKTVTIGSTAIRAAISSHGLQLGLDAALNFWMPTYRT